MTVAHAFQAIAIALGLGLLVGLQRERGHRMLAGIRTFPLITILGTISGLLAPDVGPWVILVSGLGVIASTIISNIIMLEKGEREGGITTEIAILIMFGVGVLLAFKPMSIGVVVAGIVVVLLHLKTTLHAFVDRLGENDVRAVMQFALITLVILPVLPDQAYGPFDVLNPRNIWLMVVLVVGISLAAYVAYRVLGEAKGTVVAALLGGAISSTATTVSYSRQAGAGGFAPRAAVLAIMLASTVTFVRILIEIGIVARDSVLDLTPPIAIMLGVMALIAVATWFLSRRPGGPVPVQENPTQLRSALIFGALYAIVLLAVAAGEKYFGNSGIYVVALVSGLTDMDAITLSTARLVDAGTLAPHVGWQAILIASLSNLVFKAGIVALLGGKALAARVSVLFAIAAAAGLLIIFLW